MRLAIDLKARVTGFAVVIVSVAALFGFSVPACAQARVALVIGNGAYRNVPALTNPPHDAADVAASFLRLGYSVRLVTDATYDEMRRAIREFAPKARDAEMAVVYFAGHGMEVGGENWLIPTDAELKTDLDTEQEALSLHAIMLSVSTASKLGLVILDACRNNPFLAKMKRSMASRDVSRGLSPIEPTGNVLVAYAAKDGTTAADGTGRNSPFTTALLKHLETPGLEINFLFRNIRDDVIAATNGEQQPFVYGSLSRESIYLVPPAAVSAAVGSDQITWLLLKDTTDAAALRRFAAQYPGSELRKDAEARIAMLEAQAAKPPPPSSIDPHELARSLQLELKRVGCFDSVVNGEFDDATRSAWRIFAKIAAVKMPDALSPDAVKAVRAIDRRVCPLACPDGKRAQGDHCIATAPSREPPARRVNSVERKPPRHERLTRESASSRPFRAPAGPAPRGSSGFSGGGGGGSNCHVTQPTAQIGGVFCD